MSVLDSPWWVLYSRGMGREQVRRDAEERVREPWNWNESAVIWAGRWLEVDSALEQAEHDAQRWKEMYDSEHGRLRQAERERDEANTRLHSLRWLLGLDSHPGEDEQSATASHANLDALLCEQIREVSCSFKAQLDEAREETIVWESLGLTPGMIEARLAAVPALVEALHRITVCEDDEYAHIAEDALAAYEEAQG